MDDSTRAEEYADQVFGTGEPTPPMVKKKPGRKPGSKNKPKPNPEEGRELTHWLPPNESAPAPPVTAGAGTVPFLTTPSEADRVGEGVTKWMEEALAQIDFLALGTKARNVILKLQDVSPSEVPFEPQWVAGGRCLAEEVRKVLAARNQIDVIHATGDESFRVLSVSHAKDFAFPAGRIRYGRSTHAVPWLQGIEAALTAYTAHLTTLGVQVREKVVLICSDFGFGDDFRRALQDFHTWAKKDPLITVVPAVFGDVSMTTAAQFATSGAPVVPLERVSFGEFFRAVSQSVVRVSQASPRAGALAAEIGRTVATPPPGRPAT